MKKLCAAIVVMASLGALVFSAEPKVSLNAKTGANLVTVDFDDESKNAGVTLGGDDTFGVEYAGESAGAKVALKGNLADSTVKLDDYYGWMKFGALKLTAGEYDCRWANRVKNEESSWKVWEKFKYGALYNGALVKESDNIALWGKTEAVAEVTLGNFGFAASTGTDDTATDSAIYDAFAVRASYAIPDSAKVSATFAQYAEDLATTGLFAEILSVKGLNLVGGYSGAYDWSDGDAAVHAVELRARYAAGDIAVTSHNNVSFGKDSMTVYDMANFALKANDRVTAVLYANNVFVSGDAAEAASKAGNTLVVRPGVTIFAQAGATIDTGLEFTFSSPKGGDMTTTMSVPVVFRVKF